MKSRNCFYYFDSPTRPMKVIFCNRQMMIQEGNKKYKRCFLENLINYSVSHAYLNKQI